MVGYDLNDGSLFSIGATYFKYFFRVNLRYRRDAIGFAQFMNRCVTHWHFYRFTREEHGLQLRRYWSSACPQCPIKAQCTPSDYRRISRWEHEAVLEAVQRRLDRQPKAMTLRRRTVEHVFGTLKHWMGTTPFLMRRLTNVATEMSLQVLAYNLKRVISILGIARTMKGDGQLQPNKHFRSGNFNADCNHHIVNAWRERNADHYRRQRWPQQDRYRDSFSG